MTMTKVANRVTCRYPGCTKSYKTSSSRGLHEHVVHGGLFTKKVKAGANGRPAIRCRHEGCGQVFHTSQGRRSHEVRVHGARVESKRSNSSSLATFKFCPCCGTNLSAFITALAVAEGVAQ
jgi:hypothetical protein